MNRKTGDETEGPKLPEMSYGAPVDLNKRIYTASLSAILLYQKGGVTRLAPYQWGFIKYLESDFSRGFIKSPDYWDF